jgi:hypothetical protein
MWSRLEILRITETSSAAWKPYFRFENNNETTHGPVADTRLFVPGHTVVPGGLRHSITESMALKFEAGRERDWFQPVWIRAATSLAFTF